MNHLQQLQDSQYCPGCQNHCEHRTEAYAICRHIFQGVHMLLSFGSSADGIGEPWKAGELRKNRMVFIGRNLDRAELERDFKACLVKA